MRQELVAFGASAHYERSLQVYFGQRRRVSQQAEACRQQAEKCFSPLDKEVWIKLAADWMKLAQQSDERHSRR